MINSVNIMFSTTDILDRTVSLDSNTWNDHIVAGHPEMNGNEKAVQLTIEKPEIVYESGTNPKRDLFFARQQCSTQPHLYTKAIVEYEGDTGVVTTAFYCKEIQGVNPEGMKYAKRKS